MQPGAGKATQSSVAQEGNAMKLITTERGAVSVTSTAEHERITLVVCDQRGDVERITLTRGEASELVTALLDEGAVDTRAAVAS